jgi:molybdenum cofactor biosynthesis enzyme MoaA
MIPYKNILNEINSKYDNLIKVEDSPHDTSKGYKVPGFKGKIGFITSMTNHFCGSCNRLRLTADGNLKVCLFGNEEYSLRDLLRSNASEEEIYKVISTAIKRKKFSHGGMYQIASNKNRPMITIGG